MGAPLEGSRSSLPCLPALQRTLSRGPGPERTGAVCHHSELPSQIPFLDGGATSNPGLEGTGRR